MRISHLLDPMHLSAQPLGLPLQRAVVSLVETPRVRDGPANTRFKLSAPLIRTVPSSATRVRQPRGFVSHEDSSVMRIRQTRERRLRQYKGPGVVIWGRPIQGARGGDLGEARPLQLIKHQTHAHAPMRMHPTTLQACTPCACSPWTCTPCTRTSIAARAHRASARRS